MLNHIDKFSYITILFYHHHTFRFAFWNSKYDADGSVGTHKRNRDVNGRGHEQVKDLSNDPFGNCFSFDYGRYPWGDLWFDSFKIF